MNQKGLPPPPPPKSVPPPPPPPPVSAGGGKALPRPVVNESQLTRYLREAVKPLDVPPNGEHTRGGTRSGGGKGEGGEEPHSVPVWGQTLWGKHKAQEVKTVGDEPTEVLPGLFLGGHPAQYEDTRNVTGNHLPATDTKYSSSEEKEDAEEEKEEEEERRLSTLGGGIQYMKDPHSYLLTNFGIRLIVSCCAVSAERRFVMYKTPSSSPQEGPAARTPGNTKPEPVESKEEFLTLLRESALDCVNSSKVAKNPTPTTISPRIVFKLNIPADDVHTYDMRPWFQVATECIDAMWASWREGGEDTLRGGSSATTTTAVPGVLVHCQRGASRSVTILASYLCYKYWLRNGKEAFDFLYSRRPKYVSPNKGFRLQLEEWCNPGSGTTQRITTTTAGAVATAGGSSDDVRGDNSKEENGNSSADCSVMSKAQRRKEQMYLDAAKKPSEAEASEFIRGPDQDEGKLIPSWSKAGIWERHSQDDVLKRSKSDDATFWITEVLPSLFLSGHPARYEKRGKGTASNPPKYLLENYGVRLIVCCCATRRDAPYLMIDTTRSRSGDDASIQTKEEFLARLRESAKHQVAMIGSGASGTTPAMSPVVFKLNIPADDVHTYDMRPWFQVATECIDAMWASWREGGENLQDTLRGGSSAPTTTAVPGVLVHCLAGASRSVTIMTAFLCTKYWGMTPTQGIDFLRSRRPSVVNPNQGFVSQLEEWYTNSKGKSLEKEGGGREALE